MNPATGFLGYKHGESIRTFREKRNLRSSSWLLTRLLSEFHGSGSSVHEEKSSSLRRSSAHVHVHVTGGGGQLFHQGSLKVKANTN